MPLWKHSSVFKLKHSSILGTFKITDNQAHEWLVSLIVNYMLRFICLVQKTIKRSKCMGRFVIPQYFKERTLLLTLQYKLITVHSNKIIKPRICELSHDLSALNCNEFPAS